MIPSATEARMTSARMIGALFQQLRIRQWTKNLVLFAGVIFSHRFNQVPELARAAEGFFAFCLLSSSVYTLNDLRDVEQDRIHPKKRRRPIPSGRISPVLAGAMIVILLVLGLAVAIPLGRLFVLVAGLYYLLNVFYTLALKRVVLVDVMMIALMFVLRAVAGVEALTSREEISPWLLICTLFLALFLAVCKRRQERALLAAEAQHHRKTLSEYPPELVDQLIPVVTAATVIAYTIYTITPDTVEKFGTDKLVYTVPFVVYGVFRYLYLVYRRQRGGSPSEILLTDTPMLLNVVLWMGTVVTILSIAGRGR